MEVVMTEYQYIENRLKDILNNLSKSNLSSQYRINQKNAFKFYVSELKKFNKTKSD